MSLMNKCNHFHKWFIHGWTKKKGSNGKCKIMPDWFGVLLAVTGNWNFKHFSNYNAEDDHFFVLYYTIDSFASLLILPYRF